MNSKQIQEIFARIDKNLSRAEYLTDLISKNLAAKQKQAA